MLAKVPTASSNAAPGPYLGFTLQQVRFCNNLLRVPDGASVSLEYLDDVAIHKPDGSLSLEQCKSSLSGNPVSDRSEELWKTFANWASQCLPTATNKIDTLTTDFNLHITPQNSGAIAQKLHLATSKTDASAALDLVKAIRKTGEEVTECDQHLSRFLSAGDAICGQIIQRFHLSSEPDPLEGLRERLRGLLPTEILDGFCSAALGMAVSRIDSLLRKHQVPMVDAREFRAEFHGFVRKHSLSLSKVSSSTSVRSVAFS